MRLEEHGLIHRSTTTSATKSCLSNMEEQVTSGPLIEDARREDDLYISLVEAALSIC